LTKFNQSIRYFLSCFVKPHLASNPMTSLQTTAYTMFNYQPPVKGSRVESGPPPPHQAFLYCASGFVALLRLYTPFLELSGHPRGFFDLLRMLRPLFLLNGCVFKHHHGKRHSSCSGTRQACATFTAQVSGEGKLLLRPVPHPVGSVTVINGGRHLPLLVPFYCAANPQTDNSFL
jgi:hypothetical protein